MRHFKSISALLLCAAVAAGCSDDKDEKYSFSVVEQPSVAALQNEQFPVTFQLKDGYVEQKGYYGDTGVDEFDEEYDLLNITITYDAEPDELNYPHFVEVKDDKGKLITSFHTHVYIYTAVHDIRYNGDIPVYKSLYDNNIKSITYCSGYYTYSGKVNPSVFPVEGYIYEKQEEDWYSTIGRVKLSGTFIGQEKTSELNSLAPDKNYEGSLKSYIQALYKELGIN